jgi:hypothetical protein
MFGLTKIDFNMENRKKQWLMKFVIIALFVGVGISVLSSGAEFLSQASRKLILANEETQKNFQTKQSEELIRVNETEEINDAAGSSELVPVILDSNLRVRRLTVDDLYYETKHLKQDVKVMQIIIIGICITSFAAGLLFIWYESRKFQSVITMMNSTQTILYNNITVLETTQKLFGLKKDTE